LKDFGVASATNYVQDIQQVLDALADQLESQLDLDHLLSLARPVT
jgi:hypothetical protein